MLHLQYFAVALPRFTGLQKQGLKPVAVHLARLMQQDLIICLCGLNTPTVTKDYLQEALGMSGSIRGGKWIVNISGQGPAIGRPNEVSQSQTSAAYFPPPMLPKLPSRLFVAPESSIYYSKVADAHSSSTRHLVKHCCFDY